MVERVVPEDGDVVVRRKPGDPPRSTGLEPSRLRTSFCFAPVTRPSLRPLRSPNGNSCRRGSPVATSLLGTFREEILARTRSS